MQHDGEHTMRNVNENRNGPYNSPNFEVGVDWFNPQWLHQQLMANVEYRLRFADTVQRAFFNDGPLSTSAMIGKVQTEAAKIDLATVAESARWGDAKRTVPLTQANFRNANQQSSQQLLRQRRTISCSTNSATPYSGCLTVRGGTPIRLRPPYSQISMHLSS